MTSARMEFTSLLPLILAAVPVLLLLLSVPQGMGMSPEMMNMMSQMDFSQEKVQQQFNELGLKPEDVIQKVSM